MGRPRKDGPLLRQRGDVWYAAVDVNGRRVERSTGERDETEALRVAESWTAQAQAQGHEATARAGAAGGPARVTLNDVLSELLDDTRAKIRSGNRSEETFDFYEKKAGSLLAFFGHDFDVSAWSKDSRGFVGLHPLAPKLEGHGREHQEGAGHAPHGALPRARARAVRRQPDARDPCVVHARDESRGPIADA
ncbi:MAG TPA: hypothetical protein VE987_07515 [Polyangiaceae bacterium]|nr:hypothetical protein [Polyangiaceae bacterium]